MDGYLALGFDMTEDAGIDDFDGSPNAWPDARTNAKRSWEVAIEAMRQKHESLKPTTDEERRDIDAEAA